VQHARCSFGRGIGVMRGSHVSVHVSVLFVRDAGEHFDPKAWTCDNLLHVNLGSRITASTPSTKEAKLVQRKSKVRGCHAKYCPGRHVTAVDLGWIRRSVSS
jgi:hypothetical protein